jgi:hypothetical protein
MKTKSQFQHLRTGNRQSRDYAGIQMRNDPQRFTFYDFCEGIDAPSEMAAGSTTRETYTNWRGKPVIALTTFQRD